MNDGKAVVHFFLGILRKQNTGPIFFSPPCFCTHIIKHGGTFFHLCNKILPFFKKMSLKQWLLIHLKFSWAISFPQTCFFFVFTQLLFRMITFKKKYTILILWGKHYYLLVYCIIIFQMRNTVKYCLLVEIVMANICIRNVQIYFIDFGPAFKILTGMVQNQIL